MRRNPDFGPFLAIAAGALLSVAGVRWLGFRREASVFPTVVVEPAPPPAACSVPFAIASSHWSVVGEYQGTARLVPEGLLVELVSSSTTATDRTASVRGVVLGLAEGTTGGSWSVTQKAEPIPLGRLEPGIPRSVGRERRIIPGVGPDELAAGWLVVEHVLDAPEVDGGTAWTYAHAERAALHPLLDPGCSTQP